MKDDNKKRLFLPVFLGFIMVASAFGVVIYGFGSNQQASKGITYNKIKFTFLNDKWNANINNQNFQFSYNPYQVEQLDAKPFPLEQFNAGRKMYVTLNPDGNLTNSEREIAYTLARLFSVNAISACTKDVAGCENLPLKTCNDAAPDASILELDDSETFMVISENNCYVISGPENNVTMAIDKITYQLLGVIQN